MSKQKVVVKYEDIAGIVVVLRDYQQAALNALMRYIGRANASGTRSSLVLPTGAGKTLVMAAIAYAVAALGGRVLIFCRRSEVLKKALASVAALVAHRNALNGTRVSASRVANTDNGEQIVVASVSSSVTRPDGSPAEKNYDVVLYDEGHHFGARTWRQLSETFERSAQVALTATPIRGDGECIDKFFGGIRYFVGLAELVDRVYLADPQGWRIRTQVDLSDVEILGGDFDHKTLGAKVNVPSRNRFVVDGYRQFGANKRALVFAADVRHARSLAETFQSAGVSARVVTGEDSPKMQESIVREFQNNLFQIMVNCEVLEEGYDDARLGCTICARPFTVVSARTKLIQQIGRLLRLPKQGVPMDKVLLEIRDNWLGRKTPGVSEALGVPESEVRPGEKVFEAKKRVEKKETDAVRDHLLKIRPDFAKVWNPTMRENRESFDVVKYVEEHAGYMRFRTIFNNDLVVTPDYEFIRMSVVGSCTEARLLRSDGSSEPLAAGSNEKQVMENAVERTRKVTKSEPVRPSCTISDSRPADEVAKVEVASHMPNGETVDLAPKKRTRRSKVIMPAAVAAATMLLVGLWGMF